MSGEVIRNAAIDKAVFIRKEQDGNERGSCPVAGKTLFSCLEIKRMRFFPGCEEI